MLDGVRGLFGFEGIWQGTAVLYDRGTRSLWMHFTGTCFHGPLEGRRLPALATGRHTTWEAWRMAHPSTEVMAPDPRFERSYFKRAQCRSGDTFLPPDFPGTIQWRDPRLPLAELLLGVRMGEAARAYPLSRLQQALGVVEEEVGGVPLTVWMAAGERSAAAFDRRLDGSTPSFERVGEARWRARDDGSLFDLEGRCVDGPRRGRSLARVEQLLCEWYGWFAHHRSTTVWEAPASR